MQEDTNQPRIHISIAFGDGILPVIQCEDGHKRVPLKPIAEQIGVQWRSQTHRIQPGKYLYDRLGIESRIVNDTANRKATGKTRLCIRLDRVVAYLNSLNPENIKGMGNERAAEWLKSKHQEWDDALHAYETQGIAVRSVSQSSLNQVMKLAKIKQGAEPRDKAWIDYLLRQQLAELDIPESLFHDAQRDLPLEAQ